MSEITLIGLGAMGTAIGQALLDNKFELTIWNRSNAKTKALVDLGTKAVPTIEEAIDASPRVMICITEYSAALALLDQPSVISRLANKTIIQMSTGTPGEVRKMNEWVNSHGANYIDGSIMVYPPTIGEKSVQILVSGNESVFQDCQPYINSLGGDVLYVGEKIGAAAALDLAVLSRMCAITPAVVNGAHICESEGVPLSYYAELFPEGDRARSVVMSIYNNNFTDNIAASVNTAMSCLSAVKSHSEDLGINCELPDLGISLYQRAIDAGLGDHDNASLIKVLRKAS
jgi:3-hydroxyisobutyrate dehydrogenase-like beta-hydroxyacid dehydrogenase